MKKYRIGYTSGVYDLFHVGHLSILERAKELCDYLIVGVTTDELCFLRKKKYPIIPFSDRCRIIEAIKYVDKVIPQEDMNKIEVVKKYNIDVVFVGSDWQNTPSWISYENEFKRINCDVVYLQHTDGISSTILREKLKNTTI